MFYTLFPTFFHFSPQKLLDLFIFFVFCLQKGQIFQTKDMVLAKSLYAFIFSLYGFQKNLYYFLTAEQVLPHKNHSTLSWGSRIQA